MKMKEGLHKNEVILILYDSYNSTGTTPKFHYEFTGIKFSTGPPYPW